uniref:protein BEX3 isoform X1 n=1 Tax=Urocitellus parryii TaxID=9999 RepID=UPI000E5602A8|nr:protein BEX3 isoform X1 [Urocitellus parryii]
MGGEFLGDARPSRDPELQSDAAQGAVVTRVWLPAPRCPAHGGLATGPGKAEQKNNQKKISSWQISIRKTKKWSSPCRMERKTALWEEVKATSLQEIIDGHRPADLPLIFDGPYPIGRSMMGWVEMETIWKCSWRR